MYKPFKLFTAVALLFITLGTSSCFDIFEAYHFNKDGSGTARFSVDLSQMMSLLESFAASMDSSDNTGESIDQMFEDTETVQMLNQIPGISNVKNLNDKSKGIVGFSYHFASLEALNNAVIATDGNMDMGAIFGVESEGVAGESNSENFFSRKKNTWSRTFEVNQPQDDPDGEEEQMAQMAEMMFADKYYIIDYSFEQDVKKVKKIDNATINSDGKSVTIKTSMQDLFKGEASFNSQIKVK